MGMNRAVKAFLAKWLGNRGEAAAARHLKSAGLRVITTNFRTSRGEIDIIARDRDTLVFVEVKTRKRGNPGESVTPLKQEKLTLAAYQFLRQHHLANQKCRFDVVSIVWADNASAPTIEHIRNAFEARENGGSPS